MSQKKQKKKRWEKILIFDKEIYIVDKIRTQNICYMQERKKKNKKLTDKKMDVLEVSMCKTQVFFVLLLFFFASLNLI